MGSLRRLAPVGALLLVISCQGSTSTSTEPPPPATPEEVEVFCDRYAEVRHESRQEVMLALLDVAPAEIFGAIKRASELNVSFEEDEAIDAFIDRCGGP